MTTFPPALYDRAEAAYQDGQRSNPHLVSAGNAFHVCLSQIEYAHSLPQHVTDAIVVAAAKQFREDADALFVARAA